MVVVNVGGMDYHMHDRLKAKWDKIKDGGLAQIDEDRVYVVDGREGTGKSLFTIQQAAYIDPTILEDQGGKILPRICFSAEEALYAIRHTKSTKDKTRVVVFDEAFRGLSNKSALSRMNRVIVQSLMEMRQNNIIFFIVSPSFFLLEMYAAMIRSSALFHIIKDKRTGRRYFKTFSYNKKNYLYQEGIKKGWNYKLPSRFKGYFFNKYPGGEEFEKKYRKKKFDSFKEAGRELDAKVVQKKLSNVYERQRNRLIYDLVKTKVFPTPKDMIAFIKENNIGGISDRKVMAILGGREDIGLFRADLPIRMSKENFEEMESLVEKVRDTSKGFSEEEIALDDIEDDVIDLNQIED